MVMPCFDTVILSDLHLGSEVSRAKTALELLKGISFSRLILLGDIFCDLNFRRLKKEHWQFLGYIRKLSNPKRGVEVVWVEGNHDHGLSDVMSHLVGIEVYQQYLWEFGGIRHLAIHGHQFDGFVLKNGPVSRILTAIHLQFQKFSFGKKRVVGFLERFDTTWLRLSSKVKAGAFCHAKRYAAERVFCGHTHEAMQATRDGIDYFNSGSWTQARPTFITIDEEGVRIHEYQERIDDHHPGEERSEVAAALTDLDHPAGLHQDTEYESIFS
jgi:UDP-2,3-diacylglucosamine pyrophosphatase LpxH